MMKKAIPLLLFMAGIQGWVLSLPLFGPLLFPLSARSGTDPVQTATMFLNFYSLSFVIWGVILHKVRPEWGRLLSFMSISVSVCLLLSLSLFWVDSRGWIIVFVSIGLFASLPSLGWLYMLSKIIPLNRLGFALGINGSLVSVFQYIFNIPHLAPLPGLFLASAFIVLALLMLPYIRRLKPSVPSVENLSVRKEYKSNPIPLFLIIFVVFLLGGTMYQVIIPFLGKFDFINNFYGKLPYLLAMPFTGWIIDRQGFRSVIYGMSFLGLAYTIFAISSSFSAALLGSTLINAGFAFLDVFVLYALSTWTGNDRPFRFIGWGLGVYIISIRVGLALNDIIVPFSQGNYMITYFCSLFILLFSSLLVHWLGNEEPREVEKKILFKELSEYYSEKDEELKLARQVQQRLLPSQYRFPDGIEAAVYLESAKEVGGDFYDVISLDSKRVLFVIGDVTGQGLPAALIMSTVVGLIRSEVYHKHNLPDIMKQLNRVLLSDNSNGILVTLGLALVDMEASMLTYASAGHVSPYIIRENRIESIDSSSFPIGVDLDFHPFIVTVSINRHDLLVLYTDGIIEVQNAKQEMYGFKRFESELMVAVAMKHSSIDIKSHILSSIKSFTEKSMLKDDMTLLIVKMDR